MRHCELSDQSLEESGGNHTKEQRIPRVDPLKDIGRLHRGTVYPNPSPLSSPYWGACSQMWLTTGNVKFH